MDELDALETLNHAKMYLLELGRFTEDLKAHLIFNKAINRLRDEIHELLKIGHAYETYDPDDF